MLASIDSRADWMTMTRGIIAARNPHDLLSHRNVPHISVRLLRPISKLSKPPQIFRCAALPLYLELSRRLSTPSSNGPAHIHYVPI